MADREVVRDALAGLLTTALVGTGKPCKEVVGYKPSTITKAPLVAVLSAGAKRGYDSVGHMAAIFYFAIVSFVPDADAASSWTENNVEDRLDAIEKAIAGVVEANRSTANWTDLDYSDEQSVVEDVTISGAPYTTEVQMLAVTVL